MTDTIESLRAQLAEKEKALDRMQALLDRYYAAHGKECLRADAAEKALAEARAFAVKRGDQYVALLNDEKNAALKEAQQRIEALEGALRGYLTAHVEEDGCCGPGAAATFAASEGGAVGAIEDYCDLCTAANRALAPSATAPQENKLLGKDFWCKGKPGDHTGACRKPAGEIAGCCLRPGHEGAHFNAHIPAPATAQPAIDTDLPDSEGRGRVKQTCVRCQGRGLRTAPPGGSMRCDECEGRGWMWHPAAAVPPSREAAVQERGQLCVLRRRSAEASRAYLEGTISALAGVEVLASTLPKKDVRDYCHKEAERLRLALAETSDSASPREASATAASPDKE